MNTSRNQFTDLNDSQLLAQCEVDTYRASGPGGQKRNKTSSAVRIRHPATGLLVIAEESRSQHENRAKALRRLRQAFVLKMRNQWKPDQVIEESLAAEPLLQAAKTRSGKIEVGRKDKRFWPLVGLVLDVFVHFAARTSDTAQSLGISTGNLISFLKTDPKVWEQANQTREQFGQKPLR